MGSVCAGTALPAPPERRGFGGTGTTLRPLSGALLLAPPSFCDGHSPSHTRTCGSVTQPHGTPAAPGAAPALTSPLPGGVPSIPAPGDATPERPAGLGGGGPRAPPGASSRRGDPAGAPHWSARADGRARGSPIGWRGARAWWRHGRSTGLPRARGHGGRAAGAGAVPARERPCRARLCRESTVSEYRYT